MKEPQLNSNFGGVLSNMLEEIESLLLFQLIIVKIHSLIWFFCTLLIVHLDFILHAIANTHHSILDPKL
jgi:hypothetical protein